MNFFNGDDPFENIIKEFFGPQSGTRKRHEDTIIKGEEEDRVIDFVETNDKIYIIFELPGYDEKDIILNIKNKKLELRVYKKTPEGVQDYLMQKLHQGILIKKILPDFINPKKFTHTMRNGVFEIIFEKTRRFR